jgi:hypothetical protein
LKIAGGGAAGDGGERGRQENEKNLLTPAASQLRCSPARETGWERETKKIGEGFEKNH